MSRVLLTSNDNMLPSSIIRLRRNNDDIPMTTFDDEDHEIDHTISLNFVIRQYQLQLEDTTHWSVIKADLVALKLAFNSNWNLADIGIYMHEKKTLWEKKGFVPAWTNPKNNKEINFANSLSHVASSLNGLDLSEQPILVREIIKEYFTLINEQNGTQWKINNNGKVITD